MNGDAEGPRGLNTDCITRHPKRCHECLACLAAALDDLWDHIGLAEGIELSWDTIDTAESNRARIHGEPL